jgi:DNA-binding NarL/FixJ family response regulator
MASHNSSALVDVVSAIRRRGAARRRRFSPRVLLAAADERLRERLRLIFRGDDRCQVIDAAEDAVRRVNQLPPDVLVLAVRAKEAPARESVPQMTGSERPHLSARTGTKLNDRFASGSTTGHAKEASDRQDDLWPGTLLTPREVQIVSAVVDAYSNKEIAALFAITETTVKHHLSNIFDKVGVSSRLELAMLAQRHGLARPGAPSDPHTRIAP